MKEKQAQSFLNQKVVTVIVVIAVAALTFLGGIKYQQRKAPTFAGRFGNPMGGMQGRGQGGMRQAFRPIAGEIISSDEKSVTVKTMDGSTKIVLISDSTSINKAQTGARSDLSSGTKIAVFGSENSDGSVTAQSVQIDPVMRLMGSSPSPTPQ